MWVGWVCESGDVFSCLEEKSWDWVNLVSFAVRLVSVFCSVLIVSVFAYRSVVILLLWSLVSFRPPAVEFSVLARVVFGASSK